MATRWGQSGFKHPDHRVQREFERVGRNFGEVDRELVALQGAFSGLAKGQKPWDLNVLHNLHSVTKPTYRLNFSDKGNVIFGVRQTNNNEATVEANVDTTSGSLFRYSTSWEHFDNAKHVTTGTGHGETTEFVECINRNPIYRDWTNGFPQSNNGDGWAPMTADAEIIKDVNESVIILPSKDYVTGGITVPGGVPTNMARPWFTFKAIQSGVYKVTAKILLESYYKTIAPAKRTYDIIEDGMLVMCKFPTAFDFDDYARINPLGYGVLFPDPLQEQTYCHDILDMKTRFGEHDYNRNYNTSSEDTAIAAYYGGGANDGGNYHGVIYQNPKMQLGGSSLVYLAKGEQLAFFFKIYGREFHIAGAYLNETTALTGTIIIGEDEEAETVLYTDAINLAQRYERIDIHYIDSGGDGVNEVSKEDIIDIVKRF